MSNFSPYLNPAEAARALGVSAKALRLYEERGLLRPSRTEAGWRAYGGEAMARAREIVGMRRIGLSLAQVGKVLGGDAAALEEALALQQGALEGEIEGLAGRLALLRDMRMRLAKGQRPDVSALMSSAKDGGVTARFDLPWPWGGETFELSLCGGVTYLVGPLGSGKTRLAHRLAEELADAEFLGLDRSAAIGTGDSLSGSIAASLVEDGATESEALVALAEGLARSQSRIMIIDLIEHGLDAATQEAVGDLLRRRPANLPPIVVMTRSTAILDLAVVGAGTTLLLCPANHSPPVWVAPHPGAAGYEALATCLAAPEIRARTEGMEVVMPARLGEAGAPGTSP